MNSIRVLTAILVFVTSCVGCLAEADMQSKASETQQSLQQQGLRITRSAKEEEAKVVRKRASNFEKRDAPSFAADEAGNDAESVHSVAKRETRQQWRSVPWFLAKRSADVPTADSEEPTDFEEEGFEKRGIPRFIGKREPFQDDWEGDMMAKRGRPRFIGKREDSLSDEADDKRVGAYSDEDLYSDMIEAMKRGRPRFIGRRSQEKRGRPRFIGRRSSDDAALANLISALSRRAELRRARQRIANAKRRYAPRFIGKRSQEQEGEQESRR